MFEVSIETSFSAAHRLNNYRGNCEALHGHNWKVQVTVETAALNEIGLGIDFRELKEKTRKVLSLFDHVLLNDLAPFKDINPSSEAIARYLFIELKREITVPPVRLKKVSVWESDKSWVTYTEE
jgi:6-pyruvoyltetrahydropterin/6-carboxytetrahydropterin synthase